MEYTLTDISTALDYLTRSLDCTYMSEDLKKFLDITTSTRNLSAHVAIVSDGGELLFQFEDITYAPHGDFYLIPVDKMMDYLQENSLI